MRIRSALLVLGLMLGSAMSDVSVALTPAVVGVDHPGASLEQIERAYVDAYEQSGFRLVDRQPQNGVGEARFVRLTFELTGASHQDNVPGTMLDIVSGAMPPPSPCQVFRAGYTSTDAGDPDPAVRARGKKALAVADAAALAKVRRQLGVSLPAIDPE